MMGPSAVARVGLDDLSSSLAPSLTLVHIACTALAMCVDGRLGEHSQFRPYFALGRAVAELASVGTQIHPPLNCSLQLCHFTPLV